MKRVFLGGTCNGTTWRNELIQLLKKFNLDYFNPVRSDWSVDCIEEENKEKYEKCDTSFFILTPEQTGLYSIAEIVDLAWRFSTSKNRTLYFGILGDKEAWGKRWDSLVSIVRLVNNIKPTYESCSIIQAGFIKKPTDIFTINQQAAKIIYKDETGKSVWEVIYNSDWEYTKKLK